MSESRLTSDKIFSEPELTPQVGRDPGTVDRLNSPDTCPRCGSQFVFVESRWPMQCYICGVFISDGKPIGPTE